MRHLRSLASIALLLVLVGGAVAACGGGSSSEASSDPVASLEPGDSGSATASSGLPSSGTTSGLQLSEVFARYSKKIALGPTVPTAMKQELASFRCGGKPAKLEGMTVECDSMKTVFVLRSPLVTGGVASATAAQIGHRDIWYVKIQLDQQAADQLATGTADMAGNDLAVSYGGQVLTATVVTQAITDGRVAVLGDFSKQQASSIAARLSK